MGWTDDAGKKKTKLVVLSIGLAAALVGAGIAVALASMATATVTATENENENENGNIRAVAAAQREPKTIRYTLIAEETTLEIAPDVRVPAWTFNGTIPGPTLRATEGDRVIINFTNKTPLPHTVHLHGDHDEKDDGVFQEVQQGESYVYDFVAEPAGALMYHCHVMPVSQHIRMGLYGAFIVDPKVPLEPAREYVIVTGEYDTKNQLTELPQYVLFNGYADQYWDNPLPARTNELVRIYYINLGGAPAFGFHIHGTIFDAYPSGILENEPLRVQTWEVGSGNAAIFEVKWPWEGRYPLHLHGTPEEKGTMAYVNVTKAPENAVDGVDIARTKSIDMVPWQSELTKSLQKADAQAKPSVSPSSGASHHGDPAASFASNSDVQVEETSTILIPQDSGTKTSGKTFTPQAALVSPGETVTWTNNDPVPHTVDSKDGSISSGYIAKGQSFQYTFAEPGTYEYYCSLHPWMVGSIRVAEDTAADGSAS
ncbi:MAG TPA: multicopper oxidase domain-containing protein [Nitrososphaera sp.]|jgi:nitrite reductase (NO-forming)